MIAGRTLPILFVVGAAMAQERPDAVAAAELEALVRAYWEAQVPLAKALHDAGDGEDRVARQADYDRELRRFRRSFADLARRHAGAAAQPEAMVWVANLGWYGDEDDRRDARTAVENLLAEHLDSPAISRLANRLSYVEGAMTPEECAASLRRIIAGSPHRDVRAPATMHLVRVLLAPAAPEAVARAEAAQLLRSLQQDYPDLPATAEAGNWLFELEHLQIGMTAPDFTARDQDGEEFALADYRGKVVLLDWWAFWCGACMAQLPALVELSERMRGKAFAVVGINGDKGDVGERVRERGLPWRNALDGGPGGPVSTRWNIRLWPTMILLDQDGVIRARVHEVAQLETVLTGLLGS